MATAVISGIFDGEGVDGAGEAWDGIVEENADCSLDLAPSRAGLCAEVGDGLTGRRRRIVGVFEPPLLQQRS